MPTYHYRCSKCEQHLEVVQSMTDDPVTKCAACGGKMQKVLQPVGIVLKGSGFYRTDSRSGSSRSSGSSSDSSTTTSSTSSSSDSTTTSTKESSKASKASKASSSTGSKDSSATAKSA